MRNNLALDFAILAAVGLGAYFADRGLRKPAPPPPTLEAPAAEAPVVVPQPVVASVAAPEPVAPSAADATRTEGWSDAARAAMQDVHGRFAVGDFSGALRMADQYALDETLGVGFHEWLLAQMPVLLTSAGWNHLKLGDCEEAVPLLRRAEALRRSDETAKGLGVCYYKLRQMSEARDQLAYFVERNPKDLQMPVLYADTLESDGRYEEAVKVLETQLAYACDVTKPQAELAACKEQQKALDQRLESMRGRAKQSAYQQMETSRHFQLTYRSGDHEELVAFVFDELEAALDEYVETYGFRAPQEKIEVALYPQGDFRGIVVGGPEWAEGLFDGRIRIPIRDELIASRRYDGLRIVLRHELVHAMLAMMSDHRSLPPWLDEGLAQRLSCQPRCDTFTFGASPGAFLESAAFQSPYISFSPIKAGRAYRQSLYLLETLVQKAGDDIVRQIVQSVTTTSDLGSDGLLAPSGMKFADLHDRARGFWDRRTIPSQASR